MAVQIPARLGFLAIFNPTLAQGDDNAVDQIVYYATVTSILSTQKRRRHRGGLALADHLRISKEERNERLRQVGLAQGMVNFAAGFSSGKAVESVDTEKSRVLMHELEPDWWILASVDLGQTPLPPRLDQAGDDAPVEYSSRDLKPSALLLQDLLRAHSIFLLNHDTSLSALFVRSRRSRFMELLSRYWDLFLPTWSVGLRGNPVRDIFGGINLAASGELGVGVGEEERGSGEREVLEGLVGRVEGLLDLVVSRFGSPGDEEGKDGTAKETGVEAESQSGSSSARSWLGAGQEPEAEDGAIFLGVGALSRKSLRDVTHWVEDMYTWGGNAYGVIDSPTSTRRARRTKKKWEASVKANNTVVVDGVDAKGEDPAPSSLLAVNQETSSPDRGEDASRGSSVPVSVPVPASLAGNGGIDKYVNYFKLGYGTYWSFGASGDSLLGPDASSPNLDSLKKSSNARRTPPPPAADDAVGHYLIGLVGAVEEAVPPGGSDETDDANDGNEIPREVPDHDADADADNAANNSRTMLRTVHVELEAEARNRPDDEMVRDLGRGARDPSAASASASAKVSSSSSSSSFSSTIRQAAIPPGPSGGSDGTTATFDTHDRNKAKKLRVVVYVNRPFVFTFLFALRTDSLAWGALYRSLHYQLAPLRKPLLASTAWRPPRPDVGGPSSGAGAGGGSGAGPGRIYDLVWDSAACTVRCSIPNLPSPGAKAAGTQTAAWTRADALNTHAHLLGVLGATRAASIGIGEEDLERTCKTNRGWWIVWSRVTERGDDANTPPGRERRLSQVEEEEDEDERGRGKGGQVVVDYDVDENNGGGGYSEDTARQENGSWDDAVRKHGARPSSGSKEIFLIRRASDHSGFKGVSGTFAGVGASIGMGIGGGGAESGGGIDGSGSGGGSGSDTAGRLVQGIGVDTRMYIESLLRLT